MASRASLILLVALISFSAAFAQDSLLYLRWPGGICSKGECCFPKTWTVKDDFIVEYLSATGLPECREKKFSASQMEPITGELHQYWPSLSCPINNGDRDWESSWNDNGICTSFPQSEYFTKALALRSSANLLTLLANKGIVPSRSATYKTSEVVDTINSGLGGIQTAVLHCGSNSSSILRNVRLCADSTASTFVKCSSPQPSTCAGTVQLLPLASPSRFDDEL